MTNVTGHVTLTGCTVSGNIAYAFGGGIENGDPSGSSPTAATMVLTNCTISGNSAGAGGGLINLPGNTVSFTHCTVSGNSADAVGGLATFPGGTVTLADTIVAGNTDTTSVSDAYGDFTSLGHNLIGGADDSTGWVASDLTGTNASPLNPLLAPLGNYGGPTQTMPPLPGSPAIAAGDTTLIPDGITTDQRGLGRTLNGAVDIGAAQTQGFTLSAVGGNNQIVPPNTPFADPLTVSVTADDGLDPVDGGVITFAAPASGASADLSANSVVISGGTASVTATANGTVGGYGVTAYTLGADGPATFSLGNSETPSLIVNTTGDVTDSFDGLTTLREAIAYAESLAGDQTVTFDPSVFNAPTTIALTSGELNLTDTTGTLTIAGPGADLLSISGNNSSRAFAIYGGAAALSGITITGGSTPYGGAALWNDNGTATLTHCIISGNTSGYGAITTADGTTALSDTLVSNNAGTYGGGVTNLSNATTTLDRCTIRDNSAFTGGGLDNGFADFYVSGATMVLTNSTISGNTATYGGGLISSYANSVTLNNCTISGNHASDAGGLLNQGGSTATLNNCTVSGNDADLNGGIRNTDSPMTLANTIVAGNSATTAVPDVVGDLTSSGNNLIGAADDSTGWTSSDLTGTGASPLNALLAPLGDYGGPTQTMPALPGSPAIAAGSTSLIPSGVTTDQRGLGRTLNGTVDIGAVETQGYTLTVTGGDSQTARGSEAFANPLAVSITPNDGVDPVDGGVITFAVPTSGASATFSSAKATIVGGAASVAAAANSTPGTYLVTATANGVVQAGSFSLTNVAGSLVVDTTSDVTSPFDGLTTLREAIANAEGLTGNQTVTFDPSVFSTSQTITLAEGELLINDANGNLTIAGPGANLLSVSGNNTSRVFDVARSPHTVALSGLTITQGLATFGGGGLENNGGTVTLTDCTISNNFAPNGGGLLNFNGGALTLTRCSVNNNSSRFAGAGVASFDATNTGAAVRLILIDCTVSSNVSATNGGGVANDGTATFTDCTISNNRALISGGGVFNSSSSSSSSTATLTDCTISNNTATRGGGGGVFNDLTTATFTGCNFSNNAAVLGGGVYSTRTPRPRSPTAPSATTTPPTPAAACSALGPPRSI
ncbi:MAG: right-handed parallel beta-helix repeat-containing protein [Isosphaeraceae bacterium]